MSSSAPSRDRIRPSAHRAPVEVDELAPREIRRDAEVGEQLTVEAEHELVRQWRAVVADPVIRTRDVGRVRDVEAVPTAVARRAGFRARPPGDFRRVSHAVSVGIGDVVEIHTLKRQQRARNHEPARASSRRAVLVLGTSARRPTDQLPRPARRDPGVDSLGVVILPPFTQQSRYALAHPR